MIEPMATPEKTLMPDRNSPASLIITVSPEMTMLPGALSQDPPGCPRTRRVRRPGRWRWRSCGRDSNCQHDHPTAVHNAQLGRRRAGVLLSADAAQIGGSRSLWSHGVSPPHPPRRAAAGSVRLAAVTPWLTVIDQPALARPPADRAEATWTAAPLASGPILPILDGLDEIPGANVAVLELVTTSRRAGVMESSGKTLAGSGAPGV